jgi:hypothetical protein
VVENFVVILLEVSMTCMDRVFENNYSSTYILCDAAIESGTQ